MGLTDAEWRKSRRSGTSGNACVEVAANLPHVVGVRDSKDRSGSVLAVPHAVWATFVAAIKGGEFDL